MSAEPTANTTVIPMPTRPPKAPGSRRYPEADRWLGRLEPICLQCCIGHKRWVPGEPDGECDNCRGKRLESRDYVFSCETHKAKPKEKPKQAKQASIKQLPCPVCKQPEQFYTEGEGEEAAKVIVQHPGIFNPRADCPGSGKVVRTEEEKAEERQRAWDNAQAKRSNEQQTARKVVLTCAADIKPRRPKWLWCDEVPADLVATYGKRPLGRIPLGEMTLIAGRENEGKSTVAYERAARITRGQMPGEFWGTPRAVIVAATEDSWDHTIVPRLMAAGADLARVFRVQVTVADLGGFDLILPDDMAALREAIEETQTVLIILDPIISRLNKRLDSHKDAEVRGGLEPLARLAHETGCSILGVIHVNKSNSRDPLTTIMASRAFVATARAVLYVVRDPNDSSRRLLGQPKNNLGKSGNDMPTLVYKIETATIATDEGDADTSRLVWEGITEMSVNDVVEEAASGDGGGKNKETREWLAEYMAGLPKGWEWSAKIKADGKKARHSERTLDRARAALGFVRHDIGFPKTTAWARKGVAVQDEVPGAVRPEEEM